MYPLLAPGMDPSHVDLRTFYPYTPNEVKHRKRTTSAQLKVLEGIFKTDTKPNAALRTRLAAQLDMTPRGVQVWFQNRRAKEKLKASKAAAAATTPGDNSSDSTETGNPQNDDMLQDDTQQQQPSTPDDQFHTPHSATYPTLPSPPVPPNPEHPPQLTNAQIMAMRRPSLPVVQPDTLMPPNFDPSRRRSVDANMLRYNWNNQYTRSRLPPRNGPYPPRPNTFQHRPSMPVLPTSGAPSPLSPHYSPRASLPDNSLYMTQSRPVASPIPGPLPQPGFSFGAASSIVPPGSGNSSERNSPDSLQQYSFPSDRPQIPEFDDEESAYGPGSRFGSITSVASGDSAYFSDVGSEMYPAGFIHSHRRGSSTSSNQQQFLGMMSNLDVNAESGDPARRFSLPGSDMLQMAYPGQGTANPSVPQPSDSNSLYQHPFPPSQQPAEQDQSGLRQFSSPQTDSPSSGLGPLTGNSQLGSSDGSYFYGAATTPDSQASSAFSQTSPDPGSVVPNVSIPFEMPEYAPAPPVLPQQKYDVQTDLVPPSIVSSAGCYDPASFNQEGVHPYSGVPQQQQLASFAWC